MEYTGGKWGYKEGYFNYGDEHGEFQKGSIVSDGWVIATIEGDDVEGISDYKANAHLIAAAPDMYEALKELPRPKSLLEDAAYTGGDVSKKWINNRGHFNDGYNQALKEVAKRQEKALSKARGGK